MLYNIREGYNAFITTEPEGEVVHYKLHYILDGGSMMNLFSVLSQTVHVHQM